MDLQITFFHNEGKYRPISTIVKDVGSFEDYEKDKARFQLKALLQVAKQRSTTPKDLMKQGYTKVKAREYDKKKIEGEQKIKALIKRRKTKKE